MKRWLIIISVAGVLGFIVYGISKLGPGSYPYAETYEFNCNERKLIESIQKFKKIHPEYNVSDTTELIDGRSDDSRDYWYHIYFYIPEEKVVLYTWVRQGFDSTTTFAYVSVLYNVNDHITAWEWKRINDDFSWSENRKELKKFRKRIVEPLRKIVNNE